MKPLRYLLAFLVGSLILSSAILLFCFTVNLISPTARWPQYIVWYTGLAPYTPPCETNIIIWNGSESECF